MALHFIRGLHIGWTVLVCNAPTLTWYTGNGIISSIPPGITLISYLMYDRQCILIDLESWISGIPHNSRIREPILYMTGCSVACCLIGHMLDDSYKKILICGYNIATVATIIIFDMIC